MVGPQQTTGLIGQKWKTGNGCELTGTNRPTQTTPPTHTHHNTVRGTRGTTVSTKASTIRSTPNPPTTNPTHTHTLTRMCECVPGRDGHHTSESTHRTAHPDVSVVTATGTRPDPSRTRKLSLTAPMVLHPPGCGRVGHHRAHTTRSAPGGSTRSTPGGRTSCGPQDNSTTKKPLSGQDRSSLHQEPPPTSPTRWHTSASETERCPDRTDSGIRNGAPLSL